MGVEVNVGEGVEVEVGVKVRVAEAVSVGGRSVSVEVENVAVTGILPQAVKSKMLPNVSIKIFFIKFLEWMIEIPEEV
jgi:hypothetical protein